MFVKSSYAKKQVAILHLCRNDSGARAINIACNEDHISKLRSCIIPLIVLFTGTVNNIEKPSPIHFWQSMQHQW